MRLLYRIGLVAAAAALAAAMAGHAAPVIEFEKTTIDFGKLREGEKLKVSFPFKNAGDDTLEIINLEATCGCTEVKATEEKILPGKSAAIEAVFDSTGIKGKTSKDIRVISNDSAHAQIDLTITGDVTPIAAVSPERINFGTMKVRTTKEQRVVISPVEGVSFRIVRIELGGPHASVPEYRRAHDGKGTYYLRVLISAGDTPGRVQEHLRVVTDLPGDLPIGIQVFGNVSDQ